MWRDLSTRIGDAVLKLGDALLSVIPAMIVLAGAFSWGPRSGSRSAGCSSSLFRLLGSVTAPFPFCGRPA